MRPAFSLLDEPWIPVRRLDGALLEVSLSEAVQSARQYRAIEHQDPLVDISLLRLLLAFLHRALDGPDSADLTAGWYRDRFPSETVDAYAREWRDRFDLFHPQRPFLQIPELTDPKFEDPWTHLSATTGGKNTNFLFRESLRGYSVATGSVGPAEAARLMLAHQTFALGGFIWRLRNSVQAAPVSRQALVAVRGCDLHETLCLNLVPAASRPDAPWETDHPGLLALEQGEPLLIEVPYQGYAWPARAVLLKPDDAGRVEKLGYAAGLAHQEGYVDPMQATVVDARGQKIGLRLRGDEEPWTLLPQLMPDEAGGHPAVVEHAREVVKRAGLAQGAMQVDLYGMECSKSKILDVRHERLELPLLQTRKQAKSWLGWAQQTLNEASTGSSERTEPLERSYWRALRRPFERLVESARNGEPAEQAWREAISAEASRITQLTFEGQSRVPVAVAEPSRDVKEYVRALAQIPAPKRLAASASLSLVTRLMPAGRSRGGRCPLMAVLRRMAAQNQDSVVERRLLLALDQPLSDALDEIARLVRQANKQSNLDWALLLEDLHRWDDPDKPVQRRWLHEFRV